MPSRKRFSLLYSIVLVPVVLIVLGSVALSAAAVFENFRFANATAQILGFVKIVRTFLAEQNTFFLNIGEDVWAAMVRVQQIPSTVPPLNPWGGKFRVNAITNAQMRIESDVPSQDCRRIALYFVGLGPEELGLVTIQAQAEQSATWYIIYPPSSAAQQVAAAEASCGPGDRARLALVFRMR